VRVFVLPVLFSAALAGAAQAATLNETDVGGFSSSMSGGTGFTDVGSGFDVINGSLVNGEDDFLRFTNLAAGAQTLTFEFALTSTANSAQASGAVRYWETTPPGNAFTGGTALPQFNLNPFSNPSTTQTFALDSSFAGGELFVAILSFSSNGFPYSYSVSAPGNAAPVPLPPAGLLLLTAFGALALRRKSRSGDLHPAGLQAT